MSEGNRILLEKKGKGKTKFQVSSGLKAELGGLIGDYPSGYNPNNPLIIEREQVDDEKVLPDALKDEDAIKRGRKLLMYDMMKLAGSFRKIDITPLPGGKVVYYPYWLIYYKDRRDEMKFSVLDALNKRREAGEVKKSISLGLVKKIKN